MLYITGQTLQTNGKVFPNINFVTTATERRRVWLVRFVSAASAWVAEELLSSCGRSGWLLMVVGFGFLTCHTNVLCTAAGGAGCRVILWSFDSYCTMIGALL